MKFGPDVQTDAETARVIQNSPQDEAPVCDPAQAVQFLMRVHYVFFMANHRFWYQLELREADSLIVTAASDVRKALSAAPERGKDGKS